MVVHRGEVWWVDLAEPRGSEPGFRRPVIIVQEDLLNQSALATVMVVPITSNLRRARARGNVLLKQRDTGLTKDSVALACQVLTVDELDLDALVGALPQRVMNELDDGLRLTLSLS
ncbi:MAG: type II toxin-antitoxin system PemK/MazF family toxin [Myxococcota bacterium]